MNELRVFVGYDPRQPIGFNVLQQSIYRNTSSIEVSVRPLQLRHMPIQRRGLTDFTYSRFLVPYLCGYQGSAIFMDADIVVTGDICELFAQADGKSSVQVMQQQPRFEWPSVMLFNNDRCKALTPEFVDDPANEMFDLKWASGVGFLTEEWNHCVGYQQPKQAKLYHYTQGIPCWYETRGLPEDSVWDDERKVLTASVGWKELMGRSVHAKPVLERLLARLRA